MLINREEDAELDFLLRPFKASDIPDLLKIYHLTKAYAATTPCFAILRFKNYILLICSRKFCFIFVHIFSKVLSTINSRMCT